MKQAQAHTRRPGQAAFTLLLSCRQHSQWSRPWCGPRCPREPTQAAHPGSPEGVAGPTSSGSSDRSWKESENPCAPSRWRSRAGAGPSPPPPEALRAGRTHPGARWAATGLLNPANKVPSFCLEQELTPEESGFRHDSLEAWAVRGPCTVQVEPGDPCFPPGGGLSGKLFWRQSLEHQGRNRSAVPRESPHPGSPRHPGTGEGRWYLGNHLACSVQGSSPCSQLCRPP